MLSRLELELQSEAKMNVHKSSLFHGCLMQIVNEGYADEMHENGLKPFSQCILQGKEKTIWKIQGLNNRVVTEIIEPLLKPEFKEIQIEHNDMPVSIISKKVQTSSVEELLNQYYFGNCSRKINIQFVTPTAFKSNGRYVFYPDLALLFKSLINKFESFSEEHSIYDEELMDQLLEHTSIYRYNLKSVYFSLEGVKVPAFAGSISLRINGPQPLVNLVHTLLRFGEYSGIGIKTALGMGNIKLWEVEHRHDG